MALVIDETERYAAMHKAGVKFIAVPSGNNYPNIVLPATDEAHAALVNFLITDLRDPAQLKRYTDDAERLDALEAMLTASAQTELWSGSRGERVHKLLDALPSHPVPLPLRLKEVFVTGTPAQGARAAAGRVFAALASDSPDEAELGQEYLTRALTVSYVFPDEVDNERIQIFGELLLDKVDAILDREPKSEKGLWLRDTVVTATLAITHAISPIYLGYVWQRTHVALDEYLSVREEQLSEGSVLDLARQTFASIPYFETAAVYFDCPFMESGIAAVYVSEERFVGLVAASGDLFCTDDLRIPYTTQAYLDLAVAGYPPPPGELPPYDESSPPVFPEIWP